MRRLFILLGICIVSQVAVAQWSYTLTISTGGKGVTGGGGTFHSRFFGSKEECERARLSDISSNTWSTNLFYGSINMKATATQCTGPSSASNGVDALGISIGTSFYSTNSANEIRDWSNDYIERMLALNPDYPYFDPANVPTGDPEFDSAIAEISINMPGGSFDFIEKPHDNNNQDFEDYMIVGGVRIPVSVLKKPFHSLGEGQSDDLIDDAYVEMRKKAEEKRQREVELTQKSAKAYDEIKSKLDDENFIRLAYFIKSNNGDEWPNFLGITESGKYIFESFDGNNVFSISEDAKSVHVVTFEEHSWKDDNIIKAIQENGFKDAISDRFKFEYPSLDNIKGGKISFKDLKNLSTNDLRKLLPYIKGELKLKLIDASSELSYKYLHLWDSNVSFDFKSTIAGGLKDNSGADLSVTGEGGDVSKNTDTFFDNTEKVLKEHKDSGFKKEYAIFGGFMKIRGNIKAEFKTASLQVEGRLGYVQKVYGSYLYCSGGAEVEVGTHIDIKTMLKPSIKSLFYGDGKVGGFQCKNITNYTDNIPTLKQ